MGRLHTGPGLQGLHRDEVYTTCGSRPSQDAAAARRAVAARGAVGRRRRPHATTTAAVVGVAAARGPGRPGAIRGRVGAHPLRRLPAALLLELLEPRVDAHLVADHASRALELIKRHARPPSKLARVAHFPGRPPGRPDGLRFST